MSPLMQLMAAVEWERVRDWGLTNGLRLAFIALLAAFLVAVLQRVTPGAVAAALAGREVPAEENRRRARTLSRILVRTGAVLIYGVAAFMALSELGLNITPVVAGVSVGGIAIGLGAQTLVRDLLRGFIIIVENQYAVGDYVTIANVSGVVEEIDLRRTVLRDTDGKLHSVSNGDVGVATRHPQAPAGASLLITVPYEADPDRVQRLLEEVAEGIAQDEDWQDSVEGRPAVREFESFDELGAGVRMVVRARREDLWPVMVELRRRVRDRLAAEGIELPRLTRFFAAGREGPTEERPAN